MLQDAKEYRLSGATKEAVTAYNDATSAFMAR
jgi:hypothetical protein